MEPQRPAEEPRKDVLLPLMTESSDAIVVIGMHRSGTSAVTSILEAMGCYVGVEQELLAPVVDNPKGYWERLDVNELNEEILGHCGCEWHEVSDFDLSRLTDHSREHLEMKASQIVNKLDSHRPWALKDPRLCCLLPLWQKTMRSPVAVFINRHPVDVALSLEKRDALDLAVGVALWEKYDMAALEQLRGLP